MPTPAPVDVTDTPALLLAANGARQSALLVNQELAGGNSVWLGGAAVTAVADTANFELVPQASITITGDPGALYGVCDTALTARVDVLETF